MFAPYFQAFERIKPYAIETDLEKYFDIYEVNKTDVEDAQVLAAIDVGSLEDFQGLQNLKVGIQKLHMIRKIFLCSLLALDADGGKLDFSVWSSVAESLNILSRLTSNVVSTLSGILGEEEGPSFCFLEDYILADCVRQNSSCLQRLRFL